MKLAKWFVIIVLGACIAFFLISVCCLVMFEEFRTVKGYTTTAGFAVHAAVAYVLVKVYSIMELTQRIDKEK